MPFPNEDHPDHSFKIINLQLFLFSLNAALIFFFSIPQYSYPV